LSGQVVLSGEPRQLTKVRRDGLLFTFLLGLLAFAAFAHRLGDSCENPYRQEYQQRNHLEKVVESLALCPEEV